MKSIVKPKNTVHRFERVSLKLGIKSDQKVYLDTNNLNLIQTI